MVAKWTPAESNFQLELNGLGKGTVHVGDGVKLTLAGDASPALQSITLETVTLFEEAGDSKRSALAANGPYLQGESLIVPLQTAEDLGAQLTARFLLDEQCVSLEVTAQVNRPIERVQLDIIHDVGGLKPELAFGKDETFRANRQQARVVKLSGPGSSFAWFTDLGEEGEARLEPGSTSLRYTLFRQPLEKGVILVGRLALLPWDCGWNTAGLAAAYGRWFESDSFL